MSVPEGKMRLDLDRNEVWLLVAFIDSELSGRKASQGLTSLMNAPLRKMRDYLEATNGAPSS